MNARITTRRGAGTAAAALALACALALTGLALAGCGGSTGSTSATSTTLQSASQPLATGTVKGLELVSYRRLKLPVRANIDGWQATGGAVDTAPTLAPGSYKPFVTADQLQHAQMVAGSANGIAVKQAVLTFDPVGAAALQKATSTAVADQILVVLDGKVIDVEPMQGPIASGTLEVTTPSAAAAIESAIQPAL